MASTIKIKNSSTAGAIPTSSDLVQGELAVNVTDKTIFTENASGTVVELGKNYTGFKNRIINGAMMIDQRNAGASVTPAAGQYTLDRFFATTVTGTGKFSVQQTPSSTETGYAARINAGFTNYLAVTSLSAYSITSTDIQLISQAVEGFNVADLGWGTANAKPVTISFLVYSSLTGTFGGSIRNTGDTRSYPFSYSIPVANTWTQISITVSGDTTGTWNAGNGKGLVISWGLGVGATYSGAAGSWAGTLYASATGARSVVGTSGATFYITGVQLEKGSTATSFDYRPYGTELALCQRYYIKYSTAFFSGYCEASSVIGILSTPVPMRAYPSFANDTATGVGTVTGTLFNITGTGTTPFGTTSPRQNFGIEFPASVSGKTWQTMFVRIPNVQLSAEL